MRILYTNVCQNLLELIEEMTPFHKCIRTTILLCMQKD